MFKHVQIVSVVVLCIIVLHCEKKGEEQSQTNTPPLIEEVILAPLHPTIESDITTYILGSDKEGDPITFRIVWFVNGVRIGEGRSFTYSKIKKSDRIFAEVSPYDGKAWGTPVKTNEIVIHDLPPKILSITTLPESLFTRTSYLAVGAVVEDPDGDSAGLVVHWFVNERAIPETSNVLDLTKLKLRKNDVIRATAFATDGELQSDPYSVTLTIANSAPVFTRDVDSLKSRNDTIYYHLPIADPDGDRLTFRLLHAPAGIKINDKEGIIYGVTDASEFEVLVRATDTDGAFLDAKFSLTAVE